MRKILLIIPFLFLTTLIMAQANTASSNQTSTPVVKNIIKIYPNPAFNFIGLNKATGISSIIIYNLVGRKMKKFMAQKGERYNISDLPRGMYLVQLRGKDGKVVTTQRMSKK